MVKFKTLRGADKKAWRAWLVANFSKANEIWLVYPYKASGKPRINYNDAVEEALCFGWIDSTVRSLGERGRAQRFSPRNPKSRFSQANKERLKWLMRRSMIHPSVIDTAKAALKEKFVFPPDILEAIKSDRAAWEQFRKLSPSYKRIRIAYIDGARKRPEEFKKRLAHFMAKTRQNKRIGFGGIEKYY